jgi:hypothetical protein
MTSPTRLALRPGLRVARRADGQLQIGTTPPLRVTLPDLPEVRTGLERLAVGTPCPAEPPAWLATLRERGLVVDADRVGDAMAGPLPRDVVAAAYAHHGDDAGRRLAARATARVALAAPDPWRESAGRLLRRAGLSLVAAGDRSDAVLLVEPGGEPPRTAFDGWLRTGRAHLSVRNLAGRVEVGPFVAPGVTACHRCVDAHRSDLEPRHALVLEQHAPRAGEPCDPLLMELALAWAVRDLVTFVEGGTPATWSASVELAHDLDPQRRTWPRHPRCGCCWGEGLVA